MKTMFYIFLLLTFINKLPAQKNKQLSIAFVNTASAYPFTQFGKLITSVRHPGVELGYSYNWKMKTRHDWYQEFKLAYFCHRFVQHSIPLYTDIGYRYKPSTKWITQVALGAGYMHVIPATAKLKLTANGQYKNNKGIGRAQAIAVANFGIGYIINATCKKPLKIFTTYQQLLQLPFVKAYVPILPYNSLMIGLSIPFSSVKK